MGSLYQVYTDELAGRFGAGDAALAESVAAAAREELRDDVRTLVERGFDAFGTDVARCLRATSEALFATGEQICEVDHLHFDLDDFPELYYLPYKEFDGALPIPFDPKVTYIAVSHWPPGEVAKLAEKMRAVNPMHRPEFARTHFERLRDAVVAAAASGRGVVAVYHG